MPGLRNPAMRGAAGGGNFRKCGSDGPPVLPLAWREMGEDRNRAMIPALVDLALLATALKAGFLLRPAERPELVMLGAAVLVQLAAGPRGERFLGNSLVSGGVIFSLYAFYWGRAADAWPLLPWMAVLPVWRSLTARTGAFPGWLRRIDGWLRSQDGLRRMGGWLRALLLWAAGAARRMLAWPGLRYLRLAGLVCAGAGLTWPYLAEGIVGAGDAYWYTNTVADYVMQMRAGFFPLWAAQSDYSFYGGIFPLRLAPYLAHLAGVIDLATGRQLPAYAIMNGALAASLTGGVVSMYLCLGRVAPGRPWSLMGLALCYGLSPGVLGMAYAQDLYMSVCTLPFLPVAFLGAYRSFTHNDAGARMLMVGGVAAAWLAHPPIGMWCGLVIAATQVVRLLQQDSWRATWKYDAVGAGWFVLLTAYSFVSVRSLGPLSGGTLAATAHYHFIKETFPANWLPLSAPLRGLPSLQLGYGLAALGLLAAGFARGPGQRPARLFLWCAAGLIVLLLPIPFLTLQLWRALPQVVLNITNVWPMQRLMVLAAVSVVFGAAAWLGAFQGGAWPRRVFNLLLAGALAWGGSEAAKFIRMADASATAGGWAKAEIAFRPENRPMSASSLGPVVRQPRYFNHGVTDVRLEHRFLAIDSQAIIRNATDAILPGFGPGTGSSPRRLGRQFTGQVDANPGILNLQPAFTLEPGKHYLLALEFLDHDYTGVLLIEGRDFTRIYRLPSAGNERAFGAKLDNARWLALWQSSGQPEEVRLRWVPEGGAARVETYVPFANFEWREYDPAALDVVLESLLPYRAAVNAPVASYLETPRLFIPGYQARVDGRPAPVEKSPDGLVMVRLEPGRHVLELTCSAPLAVQLAYYAGLAGWLAFAVAGVRTFRREAAQRRVS